MTCFRGEDGRDLGSYILRLLYFGVAFLNPVNPNSCPAKPVPYH